MAFRRLLMLTRVDLTRTGVMLVPNRITATARRFPLAAVPEADAYRTTLGSAFLPEATSTVQAEVETVLATLGVHFVSWVLTLSG